MGHYMFEWAQLFLKKKKTVQNILNDCKKISDVKITDNDRVIWFVLFHEPQLMKILNSNYSDGRIDKYGRHERRILQIFIAT